MQKLETGDKVMQRWETGDKVMQRLETGVESHAEVGNWGEKSCRG
jgi:hypothetical protein